MAVLRGIVLCIVALGLVFYSFFWAHEERLRWFDPKPALTAAARYDSQIIRDRFGVPHITGRRDADVAFGLAYAHSEDAFQSIQRAILEARGRLAIVDGLKAVDGDYIVQLLGIWKTIAARYAIDLSPETRALLDGYAAGFNLYAAQHRGELLPGVAPIRGQDVVAIFMLRLPSFQALNVTLRTLTGAAMPPAPSRGLSAALAPPRSTDGSTWLLVNPQGPFTGPLAWYEARVTSAEGWDMAGGLFAGAPFLLAGAGPAIGWGYSSSHPDLVDVYDLEGNPNDPNFYRFNDEWLRLDTASARMVVRLWGSIRWTFRRGIWRSVQGPVIRTADGLRAVHYAGQDDLRAVEAFYRLNKAQTFDAFNAALALQALPGLNFVYADHNGRIANIYNTAFPDRAPGYDWGQNVPGNISGTLWQGYVPFGQIPKIDAPQSGFVVAADSSPLQATAEPYNLKPENFPPMLGIEGTLTNRARRALTLLSQARSVSGEEFEEVKFDTCYAAESDIGLLVKDLGGRNYAGDPLLEEAGGLLRHYNLCTDKENRAAPLALLTAAQVQARRPAGAAASDPVPVLRATASRLLSAFGRLDPRWGEVMRLRRGPFDLALAGGPDALRDIETEPASDDGTFAAASGDSFVLFANWTRNGTWQVQTVVPYGSSQVSGTRHYADQAPLYADAKLKQISLTADAVRKEATRVERPGKPPLPRPRPAPPKAQ